MSFSLSQRRLWPPYNYPLTRNILLAWNTGNIYIYSPYQELSLPQVGVCVYLPAFPSPPSYIGAQSRLLE